MPPAGPSKKTVHKTQVTLTRERHGGSRLGRRRRCVQPSQEWRCAVSRCAPVAIMSISRSRFLRGALACAVLCASASMVHAAESYPNGPIRFVVPATAGGPTDVIARVVAQHITQSWGVPVIVENRAGAGGVIGASY